MGTYGKTTLAAGKYVDRGSVKTPPSLQEGLDHRLATGSGNAVEIKLVGVGPAKIASGVVRMKTSRALLSTSRRPHLANGDSLDRHFSASL